MEKPVHQGVYLEFAMETAYLAGQGHHPWQGGTGSHAGFTAAGAGFAKG